MTSKPRPVPWRRIALYYAVAIAVALPFNLGWAAGWLEDRFPGSPLALWPFLPAALGPGLGAFLSRRVFPVSPPCTSLFGTSVHRSLVVAAIPVLAFGVLGVRQGLLAAVAVAYATGEELGWRGLLSDSLRSLSLVPRTLIVACLWWFWHLRLASAFDVLVFPVIILSSSFILGHAARLTGSVLVPGAMHALVTLISAAGAPTRPQLLAALATVGTWAVIGHFWPHPRPRTAPTDAV